MNEIAADPDGIDSDKEETEIFDEDTEGFDEEEGGFDEGEQHFNEKGGVVGAEEMAQDSDLERRGKDADGVVHVEGKKVDEECEVQGIRNDLGTVRNSEDSGLEHVPITQEELSIIDGIDTDSVSPHD